jgi:hypothetical protein
VIGIVIVVGVGKWFASRQQPARAEASADVPK